MTDKLKTQLKIMMLSNIKPNFSELSRQYGIDRRTVKKYYDGYEGKQKHRSKPSKLDKHLDTIKQKLSIKGTNIRAVYEYIISEIDSNIGTYSNFSKYVKANGLRPQKTLKGHPRFETMPGKQAQVDWKEYISIKNKFNETFTIQVFTYKLYKTRQDVFECLIASFKATGGVPQEILFDNMSSIVDRDGNKINISSKMRAFSKDFGFKIKLCNPRHPFIKGKVELANKFMTWLLPYEHEFETEADLKEIIAKINEKVNTYPCQETGVPPLLLFQKEKEYLRSLPKDDVIESYLPHDRQTIVRIDSLVTFMNSKYSVPPEYIGKPVRLLAVDNILHIYFSTELIAVHEICNKKLNYEIDHYKKLLGMTMNNQDSINKLAEENLRQMDYFL